MDPTTLPVSCQPCGNSNSRMTSMLSSTVRQQWSVRCGAICVSSAISPRITCTCPHTGSPGGTPTDGEPSRRISTSQWRPSPATELLGVGHTRHPRSGLAHQRSGVGVSIRLPCSDYRGVMPFRAALSSRLTFLSPRVAGQPSKARTRHLDAVDVRRCHGQHVRWICHYQSRVLPRVTTQVPVRNFPPQAG